jgi:hypothetical protein
MSSKWEDFDWVNSQFLNHIEEVEELFNTKDNHLMAEVIDLLVISKQLVELGASEKVVLDQGVRLWTQVSKSNFPTELVERRYNKFLEKASLDKDA